MSFDPDSGYRSRIDKATEEAPLGYYKVYMTDTRIWAEVTATERAGFSAIHSRKIRTAV